MTGCSSGNRVLDPPLAFQMARDPSIIWASSAGSMEMPVSGPGHAREIVLPGAHLARQRLKPRDPVLDIGMGRKQIVHARAGQGIDDEKGC